MINVEKNILSQSGRVTGPGASPEPSSTAKPDLPTKDDQGGNPSLPPASPKYATLPPEPRIKVSTTGPKLVDLTLFREAIYGDVNLDIKKLKVTTFAALSDVGLRRGEGQENTFGVTASGSFSGSIFLGRHKPPKANVDIPPIGSSNRHDASDIDGKDFQKNSPYIKYGLIRVEPEKKGPFKLQVDSKLFAGAGHNRVLFGELDQQQEIPGANSIFGGITLKFPTLSRTKELFNKKIAIGPNNPELSFQVDRIAGFGPGTESRVRVPVAQVGNVQLSIDVLHHQGHFRQSDTDLRLVVRFK